MKVNLGKIQGTPNRNLLLTKLFDYLKYEKRYSDKTIKGIMATSRRILTDYNLCTIDETIARKIETDYKNRGAKSSTLRHLLEAFEHLSVIQGHPIKLKKPKITKKKIEPLTLVEARALLGAAKNTRDLAIISTLLYAGLRSDELVWLKADSDVNLKDRVVYVRDNGQNIKSYNERTVALAPEAVKNLKEWMDIRPREVEWLFTDHNGHRLYRGSVTRMIKQTAARAGIERNVNSHLMRHTCAVFMLRAGIPLTEVALQLGHRSLNSTMAYLHSDFDTLKQRTEKFSY